jgi:pimeloyl-ACP methyl ester carboxylesterase
MPHVTTPGGTRLFYQQAGRGRDVVLIHAVTSNLAAWVLTGILDALAADYRVTAYDLRGHGGSSVPATGYTSAAMAADFRHLHEALGLDPAYLVGHSFGAVVAVHAAVLYPERVAGLVLSDPYFPGLAHVEPNLGEANVWREMREVFGRAGIELGEAVDFGRLFRTAAALTPDQTAALRAHLDAGSLRWLAQLPRLAPTTCGEDVFQPAGLTAERLAAVRQPVAALYDEHTPFAATRRWLAEHLAACKVDTVPGAKHVAPLQNPAAFVRLVREHLRAMA